MLLQWRCSEDHHNEAIAVEGVVQAKTSNWLMLLAQNGEAPSEATLKCDSPGFNFFKCLCTFNNEMYI